MIRTLSLFALLMAALVFAGCESNNTTGANGSNAQTIGLASNGETVTIKVGDELAVSLPQNASTGYSWQLSDSYKGVLKMPGGPKTQHFDVGADEKQLMGAPKLMTWIFVAHRVGETKIEMDYARSWEKGTSSAKTLEVTVKVVE